MLQAAGTNGRIWPMNIRGAGPYIGTMLRATTLILLLALCQAAKAQCGACTVGDTCTVDPPFPAVCPAVTPPGTVGVPFSIDVTFWIPPSFPEPTTQLNVILDEVVLNSLENVPLGLTYEASNPTLTYYPQQNPFGCVRVCGIPMEAGNDTIIIHATATGTVGGIGTTQPYDIRLPVVVYPADQDTAPDLIAAPTEGCAPLSVDFDPLISAPGTTSVFDWDFGNGNSYTGADPPTQTYTASGSHIVTLQTTVSVPVLTSLTISDINENWCGDLDEPDLPLVGCVGQPDLYFTVLDGQLGSSRSAVINNTQSHTWSGLSIPLGFSPLTLQVYDEDGISADDLLGSFTFPNTAGNFSFSQGGTSGQGTVQIQTVQTFDYTDTLTVFPQPNTALNFNSGVLCAADLGLVDYVWTLDGTTLPNETGPCVLASNGVWSVTGTNAQGCSSTSSYQVIGMGVTEATTDRTFDIFPVPNNGRFVVMLGGWNTGHALLLEVVDAIGRPVHQERIASPGAELTHALDLDGIAAGSYRLRISDGADHAVRAFVVRPH